MSFIRVSKTSHYCLLCCTGQDAAHASHVELTAFRTAPGGQRVEVPLQIVAANVLRKSTLDAVAVIPRTFFIEEHELFERAQESARGELLITTHNSAVYTAAVCRLLDQVGEILNSSHGTYFYYRSPSSSIFF